MENQQSQLQSLPPSLHRRLGAVITWAAQSAQEVADRALEPLGMTVRHFGVMTFLRFEAEDQGSPLSQQAIGERLRVDRTTMVSLIDELERKGYVKRERNPDDRRAYVIRLTPAGRRAQARAEQAVDRQASEFFGRLSEAEREELSRLLTRLVE
jgi:MarR family transcriptional regulator, lower aerobic nicotinate degradation pathway regulator